MLAGPEIAATALDALEERTARGEAQQERIADEEFRQQSSAAAFYLGRAWLDLRNDSAQAIVSFRRAIALEPAFLWAHNSLAHALFREQRYQPPQPIPFSNF